MDTFLNRFNHSTGYKDGNTKLRIGNYFKIQDGTYDTIWEIAGFDMEYNQLSIDGTTYNNGYGICLIPKTQASSGKWNTTDTTSGGYMSSYIHTSILPAIASALQNVLGSHLIQRNVLLSSSTNGNISNAYTWTTAYATLMHPVQIIGNFSNWNYYDIGEANYKLPIFDSEELNHGSNTWLRGIGSSTKVYHISTSNGNIGAAVTTTSFGVRPLIYVR